MDNARKAQIFDGKNWSDIPFNCLKMGAIFRLFEPNGTPVLNGVWLKANSDAYIKDGLPAIDCDILNNGTISLGGK